MDTNSNTNPTPDNVISLGILDRDLSQVNTSMPILRDGIYDVEVSRVELAETSDQQGKMLRLVFKTTAPSQAVSGDMINAGFPLYHNFLLTPKGGMTEEMIVRNLAAFAQSAGVATINPVDQLRGRMVRVRVVVVPERKDRNTGRTYPPSNEIHTFLKVS